MVQKAGAVIISAVLFIVLLMASSQQKAMAGGVGGINELDSTDCVEAMSDVWDGLAILNASEMEELVNIGKELNEAIFYGINGNQSVLTAQQQQALMNKFHLDFGGVRWPWTIEEYVNSHQSGGQTGYGGFISSVQPVNRDLDYLAGLYEQLRVTFPNDYRVEMNDTWGWGEIEQLEFFIQMFKQLKIDAGGNIICANFDALVDQYIIAVSKITRQDLEEVGFSCAMFQAAIDQLTDQQRQDLIEILKKLGMVEGAGIYGYAYLEKVFPSDPEPNHAGSEIKAAINNQVVASAISASNGYYTLGGLPEGECQISFDKADWSWKEVDTPVSLGQDEVKQMAPVTLRLGDMNSDKAINILDLLWMASKMGPVSGESLWADVNKDSQVNILDLLRVAQNIGK